MLQVGVHGAGLTYHNFQRPGSALVEVFPCGFHQVGHGGLMVARVQACLPGVLLPVQGLPMPTFFPRVGLPHQVPQQSTLVLRSHARLLRLTSGLLAMLQDAYFQQTSRREATVMPFQILLNNSQLCQPGAQEANADQQGEVAKPAYSSAAVRATGKHRMSTHIWPCPFRSTQRLFSLADGHLR